MSIRYKDLPSRSFIKELLETSGSVTKAAQQIGVSQPTLSLWLVKLGLRVKYTISVEEINHDVQAS